MRFYTGPHLHYCGIDLHARTMYLCILDRDGAVLLHQNVKSSPEAFVAAVAPYREDLVVAVECMFTWYWLADLCAREGISFVLGHALYMRAIHGAKAKNDKVDALKIATLLRGGTLPRAYVYPPEMRATRDLLPILACEALRCGEGGGVDELVGAESGNDEGVFRLASACRALDANHGGRGVKHPRANALPLGPRAAAVC